MADLSESVGKVFYKTRHGQHQKVKLMHVGRSRVKFQDCETGVIRKTPIEKFQKFYEKAKSE